MSQAPSCKKDEKSEFFGDYKEARKTIDYSHFKNYTKERQETQDIIINGFVKNKKQFSKPWCLFTCGVFGAGKSHVLKHLYENKVLDLEQFVVVDPDKIKFMLPEAKEYIRVCPESFGKLLHTESIFIASIIQAYCFSQSYPMIVDGSLQDVEWYRFYFESIKKQYTQYTLGIIKINCSLPTAIKRCNQRGLVTGRMISHALIQSVHEKIPVSFRELRWLVSLCMEIENEVSPVIDKTVRFNNL